MSTGPITTLLPQTTCPHCWSTFDPVDVLAIAAHDDLRGDHRVGPDEMLRFLPSRFRVDGTPLDPRGLPAPDLACPHCHLKLPEAALTDDPLVVSVLGSPSCGKSFYLTALSWLAREWLPKYFGVGFTDADPAANLALAENERRLFLSEHPDRLTPMKELIYKTVVTGNTDLYSQVSYGGHAVTYARPLLFSLRPLPQHPAHGTKLDRLIAFYDNAGESFQPGADKPNAPVTRHLTRAAFQFFLFDPTMDPRFRKRHTLPDQPNPRSERQESVLAEVSTRFRRFNGLSAGSRTDTPLIVLLTKADVWAPLLSLDPGTKPLLKSAGQLVLDADALERVSTTLRGIMTKACPDLVTTADAYSTKVSFFPVSVLGVQPEVMTANGETTAGIRPAAIDPKGVLWPFLYGLRAALPKLVSAKKKSSSSAGSTTGPMPRPDGRS